MNNVPKKNLVSAIGGFIIVAIYASIMIFEPTPLQAIYEYKGSVMTWLAGALAFMSFMNLLAWFFSVKVIPWLNKHADESLAHAVCHDEPEILDHLGIQDPPEEPQKEEGFYVCRTCNARDGKHEKWCPIWD